MKLLAPALLAAALLSGCSMMPSHSGKMASDMPTRAADGRLIGPTGHTLYVFAKDSPGMSNCNAQCAANWPPLGVASTAKPMGEYTIITRADGSKQWAYRGQPLYYFVKDQKSGDMVGDGVAGNWKVIRP
ncbi:MAG: ATP-binding protein [Burkholderiaceae bacterium]|jgi:predicted lipoprotein with Yx(FWY)xxD motif|nr:ATP-binding protein [Burkholderiaceae bacterium]MCO5103861.1 ATP-binding protein [Burkholderiaceae bacterium]